ncbi:hypothetical protein T01_15253 [Trichinella spiralis]|uniref:Uncharacterized protein n=1 Tax=Trichinella spiralis TaxID=6334 RepID=A0A0V1BJY0_TRISP|nr:hypothetical protein T01_15253 [Trichinella spiralis]
MPRCNLLSVKTDSKTIGVLDTGRIRLRHQLSFYGVPFALGIKEQRCTIRNHVDKYVITEQHYHLLMLFTLTVFCHKLRHQLSFYGVAFALGNVLWITSSHEACTVCNPCSHGRKGVS